MQPCTSTSGGSYSHSKLGLRSLALALAASVGLLIGACGEDDGEDIGDVPMDVEAACKDYCANAVQCNDETNESDCVLDCYDQMGDCQADEQSQALEDLESCAQESCDDFLGCTIGVGLQCTFGL